MITFVVISKDYSTIEPFATIEEAKKFLELLPIDAYPLSICRVELIEKIGAKR